MSNDKDNFNMSDLNAGTFEFSKTLIYLSLSLIVFRIICDNV